MVEVEVEVEVNPFLLLPDGGREEAEGG